MLAAIAAITRLTNPRRPKPTHHRPARLPPTARPRLTVRHLISLPPVRPHMEVLHPTPRRRRGSSKVTTRPELFHHTTSMVHKTHHSPATGHPLFSSSNPLTGSINTVHPLQIKGTANRHRPTSTAVRPRPRDIQASSSSSHSMVSNMAVVPAPGAMVPAISGTGSTGCSTAPKSLTAPTGLTAVTIPGVSTFPFITDKMGLFPPSPIRTRTTRGLCYHKDHKSSMTLSKKWASLVGSGRRRGTEDSFSIFLWCSEVCGWV